jgi:hypothetical protein
VGSPSSFSQAVSRKGRKPCNTSRAETSCLDDAGELTPCFVVGMQPHDILSPSGEVDIGDGQRASRVAPKLNREVHPRSAPTVRMITRLSSLEPNLLRGPADLQDARAQAAQMSKDHVLGKTFFSKGVPACTPIFS